MKNSYPKIRLLICLLVLILPAKMLHAQSEFGVKAGALYSNFKTDYSGMLLDFDWQSGYSMGAYYKKHNLLGPIGFQAELLYQRKGVIEKFLQKDSYTYQPYGYSAYGTNGSYGYGGYGSYGYGYFDGTNASWRINRKHLHYLSTPLLLSYSALKFLDVYTGAELGILLGTTGDNISVEDFNRFSFGMALGAALKLGENTKVDFRYSTDFVTVAEMGSINAKNHGFSVTIQQALFGNE